MPGPGRPLPTGEQHPNWKGGISMDKKTYHRGYQRKYRAENPEEKERQRILRKKRIAKNPEEYRAKEAHKAQEWRKRNPEKVREGRRRYVGNHPDKVKADNKKYYQRHSERIKEHYRKKRAEIPPEKRKEFYLTQRETRLARIAGRMRQQRCELCGAMEKTVFDHDHLTGNFRGWICNRCNTVLGAVHDDVGLLNLMIKYLQER